MPYPFPWQCPEPDDNAAVYAAAYREVRKALLGQPRHVLDAALTQFEMGRLIEEPGSVADIGLTAALAAARDLIKEIS